MKKLLTIFIFSVIWFRASSQGGLAIKNTADFLTTLQTDRTECTDKWLLNVNNRYLKIFRRFVRTEYVINIGRSFKF